jgi:hypothetical protein
MARQLPPGSASRATRVRQTARRVWPLALEAWRRWERLSPHEKERYKRMASDYAKKAQSRRKRHR